MKVGFLITARLKSTRLPKKLLKYLNGYMVIERVIQRAKQVDQCNGVVLCTSDIEQDDPLEVVAKNHGINVYRGQPVNVIERLKCAAESYGYDYIVGITADNPLFSIKYANVLARLFRERPETDYAYTAGLPLGVNVYGMKRCALETICQLDIVEDTEIWGKLLNQPKVFNVYKKEVSATHGVNYRMTLDEIYDYKFFQVIYEQFDREAVIDVDDVIEFLHRHTDVVSINAHVVQKELDSMIADKIDKFYLENHQSILEVKHRLCG